MMGLPGGFDSSKGKPAPPDAGHHAARVKSQRKFRQYMNRRGKRGGNEEGDNNNRGVMS